eukprot:950284-Prymnesium_polylepis.1
MRGGGTGCSSSKFGEAAAPSSTAKPAVLGSSARESAPVKLGGEGRPADDTAEPPRLLAPLAPLAPLEPLEPLNPLELPRLLDRLR